MPLPPFVSSEVEQLVSALPKYFSTAPEANGGYERFQRAWLVPDLFRHPGEVMTQSDSPYSFRTATVDDLAMLSEWQRRPHVSAWWDASTEYRPDDLLDRRMAIWIVGFRGMPFAFLQDYDVHGWPDHHFGYLPPGSRGIDQFIADPTMLGIGHGSAFIRQYVRGLFDKGIPVVGTDPAPGNGRAIAAYGKAGFTIASGPVEIEWGSSLLMECRA